MVTEAAPSVKGESKDAQFKPATTETGASVRVPTFVEAGDKIVVATATGSSSEGFGEIDAGGETKEEEMMATHDAKDLRSSGVVDVADPGRGTTIGELSIDAQIVRRCSSRDARFGNIHEITRRVERTVFTITRAGGRRYGEALQVETARDVRAPR